MTLVIIISSLLISFLVSRYYRSTNMWWACLLTITLGLLVGIASKSFSNTIKDSNTTAIVLYNTTDDNCLLDMQSLVATVTEGTTVANLGLQVIKVSKELSDKLYNMRLLKGRDQPFMIDSS